MADFPFALHGPFAERFAEVFDVEGKIPRALDALGSIAGRDVLLCQSPAGRLASQLGAMGARVQHVEDGADRDQADAYIATWSRLSHSTPDAERGHADAERRLRPGGRLLLLEDYGRDEAVRLSPDSADLAPAALRRRDAWFAARGFKIHVIHAWWTFAGMDEAHRFLGEVFGERGRALAAELKRPRVSHKLVVYHRARAGEPAAARDGGPGPGAAR